MIGPYHSPHGHRLRFYIVMITLVVGATFLFLFINNNTEGISLTSAFVSDTPNEAVEAETEGLSLTGSLFDKKENVWKESYIVTLNHYVQPELVERVKKISC